MGQNHYNTRSIEKSSAFYQMSYQERLRKYESDKQRMIFEAACLSSADFSKKLKELQDKWRI